MAHYFDTSALVKLVVPGPHANALRRWWSRQSAPAVSSRVTRTELVRSVRRIDPGAAQSAWTLLGGVGLIGITNEVLDSAARLDPATLRSLDAIHLASALDLGSDLEGFVTYDERLAAAARRHGVAVVSPR